MRDYLEVDPPIPSQKYFLLSILGPATKPKGRQWALKVRGAYETVEACEAAAKTLQKSDPHFDVFTFPVGRWFGLDERGDHVNSKTRFLLNEELNEYVSGHLKHREESVDSFPDRVAQRKRQALTQCSDETPTANPDI